MAVSDEMTFIALRSAQYRVLSVKQRNSDGRESFKHCVAGGDTDSGCNGEFIVEVR